MRINSVNLFTYSRSNNKNTTFKGNFVAEVQQLYINSGVKKGNVIDQDALERLFETLKTRMHPMIRGLVYKHSGKGILSHDDLFVICDMALYQAIKDYNPSIGKSLFGFIKDSCRYALGDQFKQSLSPAQRHSRFIARITDEAGKDLTPDEVQLALQMRQTGTEEPITRDYIVHLMRNPRINAPHLDVDAPELVGKLPSSGGFESEALQFLQPIEKLLPKCLDALDAAKYHKGALDRDILTAVFAGNSVTEIAQNCGKPITYIKERLSLIARALIFVFEEAGIKIPAGR